MSKTIMLQGTASGVGKSILSAGICRIFKQDGHRVAPFKGQNMSSNAHQLQGGLLMAKSQAIAAFACGTAPQVSMNPVLIIPKGDGKSEVIVNGKSSGIIEGHSYSQQKQRLLEQVLSGYNALCQQYDIIVAEGAGSPVELNLKQDDIANMGFATAVNCPVILVADISAGGIFASAYGTLSLMETAERALVKGIIVNKFRGKEQYFQKGKSILEDICGVPVVGVVPYIPIEIEDEDDLFDSGSAKKTDQLLQQIAKNSGQTQSQHLDNQLDILAKELRQNLDMDKIYSILEKGG